VLTRSVKTLAIIYALGLMFMAACGSSAPQVQTNVKEGERLELAPDAILLEFDRSVALSAIELIDQDGEVRVLTSLRRPVKIHIVELPLLAPHGYRLYWRGEDKGRNVGGSLGFVIEGCEDPRDVAKTPVT
jgi:methionine-rich copper-binding protein CopC